MIHAMLSPMNPMAKRPPASALALVNVVVVDRRMKLKPLGTTPINGNAWSGGGGGK